MRRATSVAYLLARAGDALADGAGEVVERVKQLDALAEVVENGGEMRVSRELIAQHGHVGERELLVGLQVVLRMLGELPEGERDLVREVLTVIFSGQRLDLVRFGERGGIWKRDASTIPQARDGETPQPLSEDELLDYTWRVAGCVGEFWTKLGFRVFGERFATAGEGEMLRLGRSYGMGLQLVNILRDMPDDLQAGRCYLPVANGGDLRAEREHWGKIARECLADGKCYAGKLRRGRLRVATVLPALLGEKTLDLLAGVDWKPVAGLKIRRGQVYAQLVRAWWS